MNITIDRSLADLYDNIPTKIIATVTYILLETIGSFLFLSAIHFERYGGDPQKRSISNRLISFACMNALIGIWIPQSIYYARVIYGCLPPFLGEVLIFFRFLVGVGEWCAFVVSLIYKCLQIYAFHFTAGLNDEMISRFIEMFLGIFLFLLSCVKHYLGYYNSPGYKTATCLSVETMIPGNNL